MVMLMMLSAHLQLRHASNYIKVDHPINSNEVCGGLMWSFIVLEHQ